MGWIALGLIGLLAFATLWLTPTSRALAVPVAAALFFGAAGYALQQHASLGGHPVEADVKRIEIDPGLADFRQEIMPAAAGDKAILVAADDRLRRGDTAAAVRLLIEAVHRRPNDAALWAGLGGAIAMHDGDQLSPTAQFAFRRAAALAPDEPGPSFFLGLAQVRAGDLASAKLAWIQALRLSPEDAPYRTAIAERLVIIDRLIAMQAVQRGEAVTRSASPIRG